MKKFRIIEAFPAGSEKSRAAKYYVEKRSRFMFIPYWREIRTYDVDEILGEPVYFRTLKDAKKFIKEYRETVNKSKAVFEAARFAASLE